MKKRNKNKAPRNYTVLQMIAKSSAAKGAHKSKRAYNRKLAKKVDF